MKRRVSIAVALIGDPDIIFLDEPSTGLDPDNKQQLWEIIKSCSKKGKAILITTHEMEEAENLCDRIAIIKEGVLRCIGPKMKLKNLYGGGYHLFINVLKERELYKR